MNWWLGISKNSRARQARHRCLPCSGLQISDKPEIMPSRGRFRRQGRKYWIFMILFLLPTWPSLRRGWLLACSRGTDMETYRSLRKRLRTHPCIQKWAPLEPQATSKTMTFLRCCLLNLMPWISQTAIIPPSTQPWCASLMSTVWTTWIICTTSKTCR